MPAAKAGAKKGPTRPAKKRAKMTRRIEVPTGRLDLSLKAGTPRGSTVRYKFLFELGKASGLSVAETRRGMNSIHDTLLKNLKANKYS